MSLLTFHSLDDLHTLPNNHNQSPETQVVMYTGRTSKTFKPIIHRFFDYHATREGEGLNIFRATKIILWFLIFLSFFYDVIVFAGIIALLGHFSADLTEISQGDFWHDSASITCPYFFGIWPRKGVFKPKVKISKISSNNVIFGPP